MNLDFFKDPIIWPFIIIGVVWILCLKLAIRHNKKNLDKMISEAPQLAQSIKPGQTVVRTLNTVNDEKISSFLEPFTYDKFKVQMKNRKVGSRTSSYNSSIKTYNSTDSTRNVTVVTITRKI